MSEKKNTTYINAPFPTATARKIKSLAKKTKRSFGKQVVWIVERFFEER